MSHIYFESEDKDRLRLIENILIEFGFRNLSDRKFYEYSVIGIYNERRGLVYQYLSSPTEISTDSIDKVVKIINTWTNKITINGESVEFSEDGIKVGNVEVSKKEIEKIYKKLFD